MKLSTEGLRDLMASEGVVLRPYEDSEGHATIGVGHLLHLGGVTAADRRNWAGFNHAGAMRLLREDVAKFEAAVNRAVGEAALDELGQRAFDAMCFPGDALVRTEDGYQPISSVGSGERVLTASGRLSPVTAVMRRPYRGALVTLRTSAGTAPLRMTPEHPVLVVRPRVGHRTADGTWAKSRCSDWQSEWVPASAVRRGDYVQSGQLREPEERWTVEAPGPALPVGKLTYAQAAEIRELCSVGAVPQREIASRFGVSAPTICDIKYGRSWRSPEGGFGRRVTHPTFELSADFLWVMGFYLAEGSCGATTISFAMHLDERAYRARVEGFFGSLGYGTSASNTSEKGVTVRVHSTQLAQWLPEWLGRGAPNKRIPAELLNLPPDQARHLLDGILAGDGYLHPYRYKDTKVDVPALGQTSRVLALQVAEIARRLGAAPTMSDRLPATQAIMGCEALAPRKRAYTTYDAAGGSPSPLVRHRVLRWSGGVANQVCEVDEEYFEGEVFNLAVEDDPSYVVEGSVVHNCSLAFNIGATGFAGSTVARRARAGDRMGAADAFLMWRRPAVLLPRRRRERAVFLSSRPASKTTPADWLTATELRRVRELDGIRGGRIEPAHPRREAVLVRVLIEQRKRIWRAAQDTGWAKAHRSKRYASLLARTR